MAYVVTVPGMKERHFEMVEDYLRFYRSLDEDQRRLFRVCSDSPSQVMTATAVTGSGTLRRFAGRPPVYGVTEAQVQELATKKNVSLGWARELLRRAVKEAQGLRAPTRPVGRPRKVTSSPAEISAGVNIVMVQVDHTWDCECSTCGPK